MKREQLSISTAGATLVGELCLPSDQSPQPTVLMIHGSGPLDRNENTQKQSLNIFNTLANQFAAVGIASFRYDKRGCGESSGDYLLAGHHDLVDDAEACIDHLINQRGLDEKHLFILGHSEGTIIAAQLGARRPSLAGLVLLTPFIEPMESILRRQARQMVHDADRLTGLRRILFKLVFRFINPIRMQEKLIAKTKSSTETTFRLMLEKVNAKWLRELLALDHEEIYRENRVPMLMIAGEKDIQCLASDVERIAAVCPAETKTHRIADLTHLLRLDPQHGSVFRYQELLKNPIEPIVGQFVCRWIQDRYR